MAILGFTLPPDSGEKLGLGQPRTMKLFFCLGAPSPLGFEDEKTSPENYQEDDIDEGCRQPEYILQVTAGHHCTGEFGPQNGQLVK